MQSQRLELAGGIGGDVVRHGKPYDDTDHSAAAVIARKRQRHRVGRAKGRI